MKIPGPTVVNLEARKGRPNTNSLHEWARNVSSHHHWANMHLRKSKLPTSLQPVISLVRQALGKLCQDAPVLSDGGSLPAAYCRSSVTTRGDTDPASPPFVHRPIPSSPLPANRDTLDSFMPEFPFVSSLLRFVAQEIGFISQSTLHISLISACPTPSSHSFI
jgi:hypothetical protein